MIAIGIDPSISSTGICVCDDNKFISGAVICSHFTKKQVEFSKKHDNIYIIKRDDIGLLKDCRDAIEKEDHKTRAVIDIINKIKEFTDNYNPDIVCVEAIAFNACGAIDELAGLNYMIRSLYILKHINTICVSPTSIKKAATGSGTSDKDVMIKTFENKTGLDISGLGKSAADLADAYWMAQYARAVR